MGANKVHSWVHATRPVQKRLGAGGSEGRPSPEEEDDVMDLTEHLANNKMKHSQPRRTNMTDHKELMEKLDLIIKELTDIKVVLRDLGGKL